jgi:hypothetical protein
MRYDTPTERYGRAGNGVARGASLPTGGGGAVGSDPMNHSMM